MQLADVTLREGDQMPGRSYSVEQKLDSGRALNRLGVGYIQPGFPATGEKDRTVVRELARETDASIVGLARALESDVDAALDADADAVDVFAPVSDHHLDHVLGATRAEMLDMVGDAVAHVTDHGVEAHVTLADAFRSDPERIATVLDAIPGARYVNLADTVGARTPSTVTEFLDSLSDAVSLDRVGVHFHDDMGCGTANALAARAAGVAKADVSVAAIGERAGNTTLEEFVVAASVDHDDPLVDNRSELIPVCRDVLDILGEEIDPRKAVLGSAVNEHESGIHTAAMLDDPTVFEAYQPSTFGGERRLLFGPGTGDGGARKLLANVGIEPDDDLVAAFKTVLDEQGPVERADAEALARRQFM